MKQTRYKLLKQQKSKLKNHHNLKLCRKKCTLLHVDCILAVLVVVVVFVVVVVVVVVVIVVVFILLECCWGKELKA